jgi:hypothetical protein
VELDRAGVWQSTGSCDNDTVCSGSLHVTGPRIRANNSHTSVLLRQRGDALVNMVPSCRHRAVISTATSISVAKAVVLRHEFVWLHYHSGATDEIGGTKVTDQLVVTCETIASLQP